jgi:aspartate aminotransferase
MFSKRILNLSPSPTVAIDVVAKEFKRKGIPVINLSVGEPNFVTPTNIQQAAKKAIDNGHTFYTSPAGIVELREAIVAKLKKENNISYTPDQIIVGAGSKQILYTIFQALCDKGDEVIIPIPNWSTFVEQTKLAEGMPVLIKLKSPFKLIADDVKKALTPKTKLLLLNSPSNPTGALIDPEELQKIAEIAIKENIIVITDEIYEKLTYTQKHLSIASLNEKIKAQTIMTNGVSKSYAMTGWRVGYAAGPKEIIAKMIALQSQMLTQTASISQHAAVEALTGDQSSIETMREAFAKRRLFCMRELDKIPELAYTKPEGAFYLFISVEKLLGEKYRTSAEWAQALLEEEKVAVVPGEAFFYPGYIRMSYAASDEDLQEAMKKIKRFIQK